MLAVSSIALLSAAGVLAFAGFLLVQGGLAFARPELVRSLLGEFASSAKAHLTELFCRVLLGLAFLCFAPFSVAPLAFEAFGLTLVLTSLVLLVVPWWVHRRFAAWAVPLATRRMALYGLGCIAMAAMVIYATIFGSFPS